MKYILSCSCRRMARGETVLLMTTWFYKNVYPDSGKSVKHWYWQLALVWGSVGSTFASSSCLKDSLLLCSLILVLWFLGDRANISVPVENQKRYLKVHDRWSQNLLLPWIMVPQVMESVLQVLGCVKDINWGLRTQITLKIEERVLEGGGEEERVREDRRKRE